MMELLFHRNNGDFQESLLENSVKTIFALILFHINYFQRGFNINGNINKIWKLFCHLEHKGIKVYVLERFQMAS